MLFCSSPTTLLNCCGNVKPRDPLHGGLDGPHPEARNLLGRLIELDGPQILSIGHALANHGPPSGGPDRMRHWCCNGC
jgi:hypothetical protein